MATNRSQGGGPIVLKCAKEPAPLAAVDFLVQPDLIQTVRVNQGRETKEPVEDIEPQRVLHGHVVHARITFQLSVDCSVISDELLVYYRQYVSGHLRVVCECDRRTYDGQ